MGWVLLAMTTRTEAAFLARRRDLWVFAGFALAVLLRLWMYFSEKSLWGDETFTIGVASHARWSEVFLGSILDVHPPLHFLILRGFIGTFGQYEWVYRLPSLLGGISVVVFGYLLCLELLDRETALVALFILALSPYYLQCTNEIRGYSLLACFVIGASFFLVKAFKQSRPWLFFYSLFSVAAIYTEHYAWLWFIATTLFLIYRRSKGLLRSGILRAHFLAFCLMLPSLALIAYQACYTERAIDLQRVGEFVKVSILFKKVVGIFWHFSAGYVFSNFPASQALVYLKNNPFFWISGVFCVISLLLAFKSLIKIFITNKSLFLWLATTVFFTVFFLAAIYAIRLHGRYLSFVPIFYVILTASSFVLLSRPLAKIVFCIWLAVALTGSIYTIHLKTDAVHRDDFMALYRAVSLNEKVGDLVCGAPFEMQYYGRKFGKPLKSKTVQSMESVSPNELHSYDRVWYLFVKNIDADVSEKIYRQIREEMSDYGYIPAAPPVIAGKNGALFSYLFVKNQGGK